MHSGEIFYLIRDPIWRSSCSIGKSWVHTSKMSSGISIYQISLYSSILAGFRFGMWQYFHMQSKLFTCRLFKANCLWLYSLAKQEIMLSVCVSMSEVPWLFKIQGSSPSRQNVLFTTEKEYAYRGESWNVIQLYFMGTMTQESFDQKWKQSPACLTLLQWVNYPQLVLCSTSKSFFATSWVIW